MKTPDPPTTSAEPPETRTLGQTTGGTGASPEQFADHRPDQAQLTTRDNAAAESFWATLKVEFYDRYLWPTRAAAKLAVGDWIERVYNRRRRHSALGMISLVEYEDRFTQTAQAA